MSVGGPQRQIGDHGSVSSQYIAVLEQQVLDLQAEIAEWDDRYTGEGRARFECAEHVERLQAQIVRLEAVVQAAQDVIDASLMLPSVAAMPQPLRSPCAQLALTLARFYKALDTP